MEPALGLEVDPRRGAAHQAVDVRQVLAAAELLARAAEEDDRRRPRPSTTASGASSTSSSSPTMAIVGVGGMLPPSVSL